MVGQCPANVGCTIWLADAEQATTATGPADLAALNIVSIAGVVTPGARRLRFSHSSATWRPTAAQSCCSSEARIATATSRILPNRD